MASDMAAKRLIRLMSDPKVPHNVQLAAAKDLLDRANVAGTQQVEVVAKYERLAQTAIVMDFPEGDEVVDAEVVEGIEYSPEERAAMGKAPKQRKAATSVRRSGEGEDSTPPKARPTGARSRAARSRQRKGGAS